MPLKTPSFWSKKGVIPWLLSPVSWIYYAGHRINTVYKTPYKAPVPILCIGGIVAGGSGKTPTLQALLSLLQKDGLTQSPVIVMRGYGGKKRSPHLVSPAKDSWKDVGDEALLHAQHGLVIVSKNRKEGIIHALGTLKPDVILLDDGLQNNSVSKTLSFLVIESDYGLGNGKIIPAGPLREPWEDAISKADAVILIGHGSFIPATDKPIFRINRRIQTNHLDKNTSYVAFAGIGRPNKFKQSLTEAGLSIHAFQAFSDHHVFTAKDLDQLLDRAKNHPLITTEKDYVRLPPDFQKNVAAVPVSMFFEEPEQIISFIKTRLMGLKP